METVLMSTSRSHSVDRYSRTPWHISPYRADWQTKFRAEKERLEAVFGDAALEIEHIGSTAVEGLAAKPIIDIAVMVKSHKDADGFIEPLAQIGYDFDQLSTERHFYAKGDPIDYHLSIAYMDRGGFWDRQILFRDYLRANPDARDEYAALKKQLLQADPSGNRYDKTEFVNRILRQAEGAERIR
ncbi:MAG: GrpB family protein [Gemmatimonadetes bacterium]|nr:GrpB family protein [Gemmatimonadota bacterium]